MGRSASAAPWCARRCRSCRRRRWWRRGTASAPSCSQPRADAAVFRHRAANSSRPARRGRDARAAHRRRDRGGRPGGAAPQRRQPGRDARRRSTPSAQRARGGGDAVAPDFRFHLEIARATGNRYFADILSHLGTTIIPRARLDPSAASPTSAGATCAASTPSTKRSSTRSSAATAKSARAAMRTHLANSRERLRAPRKRPSGRRRRCRQALSLTFRVAGIAI